MTRLSKGQLGALAALAIVSLAIRAPFQAFAIGEATHDDLLFVLLARHLGRGDWLGQYNYLTLAKGAGFPMFMAVTSILHVPLKLAEHVLYLGASLFGAVVLGRVVASRTAVVVLFALLAFNPVFWSSEIGGRVVRESFYIGISLILLALVFESYLPRAAADDASWAIRRKRLVALGIVGAWYWLTREEGAWLVPSIAVVVASFLVTRWRGHTATPRAIARDLGLPVAVFLAVVATVNTINYFEYGVFQNNDFRARHFPAAYGALARIEHERWQPYVVFPRDARVKAYAASPAARELAPLFEGERGEEWRRVGCEQTNTAPCPEILSGWFMWALREAIDTAGYRTAPQAREFQRRLAREIDQACKEGRLRCGPRTDSLLPPWRPEYLERTVASSLAVARRLRTFDDFKPWARPSRGPAGALRDFEKATRGPLMRSGEPTWAVAVVGASMARVEGAIQAYGLPLAFLSWLLLLGWSAARREWHPGHVAALALWLAIATRIVLLGFLDATSIPSDNMLYLSPVTPMAILVVPFIAFLGLDLLRKPTRRDT